MFDLNIFDTVSQANKGSTLHLVHPKTKMCVYADKEEKKPVTITMLGADSDIFAAYVEKAVKENRSKEVNKKLNGNKEQDFTLEELAKSVSKKLAKVTTSFENLVLPGDKTALVCNYENAYNLYMKYKDIREQANEFFEDKVNFITD